MGTAHTISPLTAAASLAVAWLSGVAALLVGDRTGVHDPTCAQYGTICPGDLRAMALWPTAEVLGLGVLLGIWRAAPASRLLLTSWRILLGVWVLEIGPLVIHQGAVTVMHACWHGFAGVVALVGWLVTAEWPHAP